MWGLWPHPQAGLCQGVDERVIKVSSRYPDVGMSHGPGEISEASLLGMPPFFSPCRLLPIQGGAGPRLHRKSSERPALTALPSASSPHAWVLFPL